MESIPDKPLEAYVAELKLALEHCKQTEAALRRTEEMFRLLWETTTDAVVLIDADDRILYANPAIETLFGYRPEALIGQDSTLLQPVAAREAHRRGLKRFLETGVRTVDWRARRSRGLHRDGHEFPVEISYSHMRVGDRPVFGGFIRDISDRERAERRIERLNRVNTVLSGVNSAIVRLRDREDLLEEICRIAVEHGHFGIAWIGLLDAHTQWVEPVASRGIDRKTLLEDRVSAAADHPAGQGTAGQALRSGAIAVCNDIRGENYMTSLRREALDRGFKSIAALPLKQGEDAVGVIVLYAREAGHFDADELKLLDEVAGDIAFGLQYLDKEEQLSHLAYYDALTGLANGKLFIDRLEQFVLTARHKASTIGVVLLDLDRFTQLNDTLGRHTGDRLLAAVADRFREALREPYSLARIGSDTYAVAIPDLRSGADAATVVEDRLLAALRTPIALGGHEVRVTARAGIALFPGDGDTASTLFNNAEAALKHAQASGERYLFYSPQINATVAEHLAMEARLRTAAECGQFELHYQPKIGVDGASLLGLEALLSWDDPDAGPVPPTRFIPILEESRQILEVGQWVLEQALADYRRWRAEGLAPPRIAVNVSPLQLRQPDFVDKVRQAIDASGVGAQALELEITESVIMDDIDANIRTLTAIRELGVTIAIDDFGTGYASFRYLAKLPVDTLKIDRSFIVTMTDDPDSMAIVSTMITLAHSMNCKVVAEGVDSEDQARFLRLLRCDQLQGFLFARPLPADDIARRFIVPTGPR